MADLDLDKLLELARRGVLRTDLTDRATGEGRHPGAPDDFVEEGRPNVLVELIERLRKAEKERAVWKNAAKVSGVPISEWEMRATAAAEELAVLRARVPTAERVREDAERWAKLVDALDRHKARAEAAEAKLARAVEALRVADDCGTCRVCAPVVRAALEDIGR